MCVCVCVCVSLATSAMFRCIEILHRSSIVKYNKNEKCDNLHVGALTEKLYNFTILKVDPSPPQFTCDASSNRSIRGSILHEVTALVTRANVRNI